MDCRKERKVFRAVGIAGQGTFDSLASDVPALARHFLARVHEVPHRSDIEITLFEPKKDASHSEGRFYVGIMVHDAPHEVPSGMEYLETAGSYATTRGKTSDIADLHRHLLTWASQQGDSRDLESYIVETYHPTEEGEEVEIYLPIRP